MNEVCKEHHECPATLTCACVTGRTGTNCGEILGNKQATESCTAAGATATDKCAPGLRCNSLVCGYGSADVGNKCVRGIDTHAGPMNEVCKEHHECPATLTCACVTGRTGTNCATVGTVNTVVSTAETDP